MSIQTDSIESNSLNWLTGMLLKRSRPVSHVFFWIAVLLFYTLYFGSREDGYGQSLLFVLLLLPITIGTTYFLLYWLIPRYLLKQRYLLFTLYLVYTIVFSLYLELLLVLLLYINVSGYQEMFVKPGLVDLLDVLVSMYLVVFLAVAINLLRRWSAMRESNAALEKVRIETELKLRNTELQLLKSQIQPHFLFNTLNNLYALALQQSEHVPDVVLSISQQLDYVLYRGNQARVPICEEMNQIQNYISLQRLRYPEERLRIDVDTEGDLTIQTLPPLLLIPFVENSFKHGISPSNEPGWIELRLSAKNGTLVFHLKNSKRTPSRTQEDASTGIGLSNVRRRLELLFPDSHTLEVSNQERSFSVHLTLKLDEAG